MSRGALQCLNSGPQVRRNLHWSWGCTRQKSRSSRLRERLVEEPRSSVILCLDILRTASRHFNGGARVLFSFCSEGFTLCQRRIIWCAWVFALATRGPQASLSNGAAEPLEEETCKANEGARESPKCECAETSSSRASDERIHSSMLSLFPYLSTLRFIYFSLLSVSFLLFSLFIVIFFCTTLSYPYFPFPSMSSFLCSPARIVPFSPLSCYYIFLLFRGSVLADSESFDKRETCLGCHFREVVEWPFRQLFIAHSIARRNDFFEKKETKQGDRH